MEEFRSAALVDAEVKGMDFRGYAAVFDQPWSRAMTEKMGYVEKVARGAFRKALAAGNNIPLTWQHNRDDMLATTRSGNLSIREDGKGLLVEAKLPPTQLGEYVRSMIEAGDVHGMSYGIETDIRDRNASQIEFRDGVTYRTIKDAHRLIDTCLTWDPAYDGTTVELRMNGFAAIPLQELVDGTEVQIGDAAEVATSFKRDLDIDRRVRAVIHSTLEGGWQ